MRVAELWRYPVKSMAGEPLQSADLRGDGIAGDRVVHVGDARGRMITARSRPRLLGPRAAPGTAGEPLVDGRPWRSAEVGSAVVTAAGEGARLVRFDGPERFDVLPLLVATDGAIQALGHDRRRLRPNLLIGGVGGLAEREWEGRGLRAGPAIIGVDSLRARCVITTFDPHTQQQDRTVLERILREFDGPIAPNCYGVKAGTISIGDPG